MLHQLFKTITQCITTNCYRIKTKFGSYDEWWEWCGLADDE